MKKILFLFLLIISFKGFSQTLTPPNTPGVTGRSTLPVEDKFFFARQHLGLPRYNDTTQANVYGGIDTLGAQIYTYDWNGMWFRAYNTNGTKYWRQLTPGGTPSLDTVSWGLQGNYVASMIAQPFLGTNDNVKLNIGTNGQKRMVIPAAGIVRSTASGLKYLAIDTTASATNGNLYYTDGSATTDWSILGNAGTTFGTNFFGTTDARGVRIKLNSANWGQLDVTTNYNNLALGLGALGTATQIPGYLGLTGQNIALGTGALENNTGGAWNFAGGYHALWNNTTGAANIAIGTEAMNANTTGIRSIALGNNSLATNPNPISNFAGGNHSMQNAYGDENTAVGMYSLSGGLNIAVWTGGQNSVVGFSALKWGGAFVTALGYNAHSATSNPYPTFPLPPLSSTAVGYYSMYDVLGDSTCTALGAYTTMSNSLVNATAIGARASVTQSNSIVLGSISGTNGGSATVKVGIGTTAPATNLHVAGTLRFVTGNQGANKVLASDGSGNADWVTPTTGTVTSVAQSFTGGLISVGGSPITSSGTLALTVAGTSGGGVYFSSTSTWASTGLLSANAIMIGGGAGTSYSTTTTGANVLTALGVAVGSAGAFVVNGGVLGTPSSGTVTNLTGTASININGTVGATTPAAGTFTSLAATSPAFTTSITTPSTTFALVNTTATTVNAFGAATTLNIGASATMILNFGGSTTASEFRFLEPSASGTNYSAFKAIAQSANITYSLPPTVGAAGTQLTDVAGNGVLTWAAASSFALTNGSGTTAAGTAVNLGGTATGDINLALNGNQLEISGGLVNMALAADNFTVATTGISKVGDIPNGIGLEVNGSTGTSTTIIRGINIQFADFGAGAITSDGSGNLTAVSDRRVKHSITSFNYGLNSILKLNPSSFIYNKDKTNTVMSGFIAQDVQKAIPMAVHEKNGVLSLETNAILGATVNSIHELYSMIVKQQKEIEALKKQLKK